MKLLSKSEELILLAVLRLKDQAYCVPIRDQIRHVTEKDWSFGSIYIPLNRLESKGLIDSFLGPSAKERGGRPKRYYRLTEKGLAELRAARAIKDEMWEGIPENI